jgi:hypothetical protein
MSLLCWPFPYLGLPRVFLERIIVFWYVRLSISNVLKIIKKEMKKECYNFYQPCSFSTSCLCHYVCILDSHN